ncbi:MAG TPA: ATP-binding protein [Vicinamibacterales bacterium]|nr:ATP-binding protein [Vicinamibacterales bacterium]
MKSVAYAAYVVGYGLLFVTVVSSAYAVWRRRELHRIDILVVVATLMIGAFAGGRGLFLWFVRASLLLSQPYFLLRLVRHFREVPRWLLTIVVLIIPSLTLVLVVWRPTEQNALMTTTQLYCAAIELYAATAFTHEARRTAGVTARRLVAASAGSWMLAANNVYGALSLVPAISDAYWFHELMIGGIGFSFFLAFATPRYLRARWQRLEQARYLSAAADRTPEERGRLAAADLTQAAARSMGHSLAVVALRDEPAATDAIVRAATLPSFVGLRLAPAGGLLGRAIASDAEQSGRLDACEPELAAAITGLGASVLVAPISSTTTSWGAAVIVQRRGSLFPEDDLRLLGQFARHAATALDHARLIADARERERRAAERRLREVESRMSLMLDSIKDYALFVLDERGRVAIWEAGAEHVFGYTSSEMTDEPAATLFDMSPPEFDALISEAQRLGHADREGPCRRRDGSKFVGAMTIRPLQGEVGDPPGLVVVTHDVTAQRNLEARLQQSQKMEAIGQLAGGIAHDFNNLLTAILGYAEWLERSLASQPERKEEVGEIQRAAERAAALTRQLLAFSRHQISRPAPVNLSRLVMDLVPMLRRVIGEQVVVTQDTPVDIGAVLGDHNQLEQVVLNLAVNARDAMPRGGRLTLRTAMVQVDAVFAAGELTPGRHVLLEVADTGTGIDRATLARIFEPFFTTKQYGGTGLGLATVYGIVKQMAGAIRVESEVGRGTTFRLYFPETHEPEADKPEPVAGDIPLGHETILIVEDDDVVLTFLRRALDRHGYRVLVAEHPTAGLALAKAYPDRIHLVITDVVLPGMTGLEFVREFASIQSAVPTLYISGYADAVLAREGTRPKASQFLQKPFSAAELLKRVRLVLTGG